MNTAYCKGSLIVKASNSDDPNKNIHAVSDKIKIKVPESTEHLKGNLFIIKVKMGETNAYREFFYVYKWYSGKPSEINDNDIQTSVWILKGIETKNKEESFGKLTRKLNGEAGNLVFSYENGNNNSRLVVKGNWETLPEILIPDEIVSLSADLKIEKFTPPTHHWSPINSLNFTSFYATNSFEERKMNTAYCKGSLIVKASNSDDPNKNIHAVSDKIKIKVPESTEHLKGNLFIIKVKMGETNAYREYFYIYEWQSSN
jgi:acetolactate synthase small subunit